MSEGEKMEPLLREYVRGVLMDEVIQEGKFQDAISWIKEKGRNAAAATKDFFMKLKTEWGETKEGAAILGKMVTGVELSKQESEALKQQVKDLAKGIPLLSLVALPGGGIATVALVKLAKKYGIDLLPSAFKEDQPAGDDGNELKGALSSV